MTSEGKTIFGQFYYLCSFFDFDWPLIWYSFVMVRAWHIKCHLWAVDTNFNAGWSDHGSSEKDDDNLQKNGHGLDEVGRRVTQAVVRFDVGQWLKNLEVSCECYFLTVRHILLLDFHWS